MMTYDRASEVGFGISMTVPGHEPLDYSLSLRAQGTAYLTDAGMCGPRDSIIGVKIEPSLDRFLTGIPHRFETAAGPVELNGVAFDCDEKTGKANSIKRIQEKLS